MTKVLAKAIRDRRRPLRARPRRRLWHPDAAAQHRREHRHRRRGPAPGAHPQHGQAVRRDRVLRGAGRQRPGRARPRAGAGAAARRSGGGRRPRVDVAGADPGRAAPRPVRVPGPAAHGGGPRPQSRTSASCCTGSARPAWPRSTSPTTTCRCSTRRERCSGPRRAAGPTRKRRAPTATSSWTRPRTCRPCSCGCSPAARSTAR